MQLRNPLLVPTLAAAIALAGCRDASTDPRSSIRSTLSVFAIGVTPTEMDAVRSTVGDIRLRVVPALPAQFSSRGLTLAVAQLDSALTSDRAAAIIDAAARTRRELAAIHDASADADLDTIRRTLDQLDELIPASRLAKAAQ